MKVCAECEVALAHHELHRAFWMYFFMRWQQQCWANACRCLAQLGTLLNGALHHKVVTLKSKVRTSKSSMWYGTVEPDTVRSWCLLHQSPRSRRLPFVSLACGAFRIASARCRAWSVRGVIMDDRDCSHNIIGFNDQHCKPLASSLSRFGKTITVQSGPKIREATCSLSHSGCLQGNLSKPERP